MLSFRSGDLWAKIGELARRAKRKRAAVSYVTSDEVVTFDKGDLLITDASDSAIAGGRTSASVLRAAHARGAHLVSVDGLHAKVLCLDRFVVVGSANLSASSVDALIEAGVVADDPGMLAEATAFISELQDAGDPIDSEFLDRISLIPVARPSNRAPTRRRPVRHHQHCSWIIGIHRLDETRYEHEAEYVEEGTEAATEKLRDADDGVSWIRFTGNSKFRQEAQPGDTVLQIWRPSVKSKRVKVYFSAPIIHRQDEPDCTRFFVQEFADEDERAITWKEFASLWSAAVQGELPPLGTARLVKSDAASRIVALWPGVSS